MKGGPESDESKKALRDCLKEKKEKRSTRAGGEKKHPSRGGEKSRRQPRLQGGVSPNQKELDSKEKGAETATIRKGAAQDFASRMGGGGERKTQGEGEEKIEG